jgi:hypothetical protein
MVTREQQEAELARLMSDIQRAVGAAGSHYSVIDYESLWGALDSLIEDATTARNLAQELAGSDEEAES